MKTLTILLGLSLTLPAMANFWEFENYSSQDWANLESEYIRYRRASAEKMRERVDFIGRKNGGIAQSEEITPDAIDNAPTEALFTTENGVRCVATIFTEEVTCEKDGYRYYVSYFGRLWKK